MPRLDLARPRVMVEFWFGKKQLCRVRPGETSLDAVTRKVKELMGCDRINVFDSGKVVLTYTFRWFVVEGVRDGVTRNEMGFFLIPDIAEMEEIDFSAMLSKVLTANSHSPA